MLRRHHTLIVAGITLGVVVAVAATVLGAAYLARIEIAKTGRPASPCPAPVRIIHGVVIRNGQATPAHTTAALCDGLSITNFDDTSRFIAFGPHENHVAYDGITERVLAQGQTLTVTLVQAGDFRFHDHLHDEVQGTFTVTEPK